MNNSTVQIFLPSSSTQATTELHLPTSTLPTVDLENVEDFSKVCRVCASVTELVIPIFSGEGLRNNLADKIFKHLPIKVTEQDSPELPVVMCYQCASTLLATHELVKCSMQADTALRTRAAVLRAKRASEPQEMKTEDMKPPSIAETAESQPLEFSTLVHKVLAECLRRLDIEEDISVFEFVCQKCSVGCGTEAELVAHLAVAHNSRGVRALTRAIKDYIIFVQSLDTEDRNTATEPKLPTFCCPFCESVFSSPNRLAGHLGSHVEISAENVVECCGELFTERLAFVAHAQSHAPPPPPAACRTCGYCARNADDLTTHVREKHSNQEKPRGNRSRSSRNQKYIPIPCPDCGRTFSNKYNMAKHAQSHRGATERFPCDRCPRTYSSNGALVAHVKIVHLDQLRFVCASCGERFPNKTTRDVHAALHTGALPHVCPEPGCPRAFRARNSLLRHLDVHRDRRPHRCAECARAFRRAAHLAHHSAVHRRSRTSSKPFKLPPANASSQ